MKLTWSDRAAILPDQRVAALREAAIIFSTRYCALDPTAYMNIYRQAVACPRAAQKTATYRSLRSE